MDRPSATLRVRIGFINELGTFETPEKTYPDETSAIAQGKKLWPTLCEQAASPLAGHGPTAVTVIDRQGQVCWERQAPIVVDRDLSFTDEAWVLDVLRFHGPLSRPRLIAVAGLKPAAVDAQLRVLQKQGRISRCGEFPQSSPGRRAFIWDIVDGPRGQAYPSQAMGDG